MKASVIGGTGLVGGEILAELLADPEFSEVEIFTRRATGVSHQKLTETFVDFDDPASWASKISGEVLFSAFGTTISAAGSREAQYLVDFHYQLDVARWARSQGVSRYVLISSSGADPRSLFFYLRMKGELESAVKELGFAVTVILRPGPLRGKRKIVRFGESVSTAVLEASDIYF
jgi:uncharacterized protein YbjT (DUF2867 family)